MSSKNVAQKAEDRNKIIIRTSVIGIIANIFLVVFKMTVGLLANSIAVILDAVNNLSDAVSSVITIVGTKLSGKKPDKKHPYGYGRIEYLSAMIVSAIVVYAGITAFTESVKKIIYPETADYSVVSLIIIGSAVVVKFFLGRYVKSVGKKINSGSLISSGSDALFDSILSLSVFVSAIICMLTGISLEAYVGLIIAVFIVKSGLEMLKETLDDILGKRVDAEFSKNVKNTVCEFEEVEGAYDLFIDNYGSDYYVGSLHIEIPDTMTADRIDKLTRQISEKVYKKHGVIMTGISVYSVNTKNDKIAQIQTDITKLVMSNDEVLQMHGFYADEEEKTIRFDVVVDYTADEKFFERLTEKVQSEYSEYSVYISRDFDISD